MQRLVDLNEMFNDQAELIQDTRSLLLNSSILQISHDNDEVSLRTQKIRICWSGSTGVWIVFIFIVFYTYICLNQPRHRSQKLYQSMFGTVEVVIFLGQVFLPKNKATVKRNEQYSKSLSNHSGSSYLLVCANEHTHLY